MSGILLSVEQRPWSASDLRKLDWSRFAVVKLSRILPELPFHRIRHDDYAMLTLGKACAEGLCAAVENRQRHRQPGMTGGLAGLPGRGAARGRGAALALLGRSGRDPRPLCRSIAGCNTAILEYYRHALGMLLEQVGHGTRGFVPFPTAHAVETTRVENNPS